MNADPRPHPRHPRPRRRSARPRAARRVAGLLVAGGVAFGAAACSSDTTTTAGPAATTPAVTASAPGGTSTSGTRAGTTPPATARTGSTRGTTSTTSRSSSTGTSDPNVLTPPSIVVNATPGNEEYCAKVATALQDLTALALASIGGGTSGDELLPQVKSLYADLADTAPSDIKDDVQVISAKLQSIKSAKELRSLDDDAEASAAGQRFTAWIKSQCGFDPNNPGS